MTATAPGPSEGSLGQTLGRVGELVEFAEGDVLFHEGETSDSLYLISRGSVRIELEREEIDSETVLATVSAGGMVGELGLLDGSPRSATAIADGPVSALRVGLNTLRCLESDDPAAAAQIYRALGAAAATKLRRTNNRLAATLFDPKDAEVTRMVAAARTAQPHLAAARESEVDSLLDTIAEAFTTQAEHFARLTVEITGIGNVPDKIRKNRFAAAGVRETLRGQPGAGLLGECSPGVEEIAGPAGVVFGLIPVTNPIATAIFKTLICLKSRNALILSFPRRASALGDRFFEVIAEIFAQARWSADLVQGVTRQNSRHRTEAFFHHPGVDLILATGGPSMVRAAYSSGKPAFGVGAGNAPVLVCGDADLATAAAMIVESKSFDNGLICGSEHNLIAVEPARNNFIAALEAAGAAVLSEEEGIAFRTSILDPDQAAFRRRFTGRSAAEICVAAGIERAYAPRVVVVPATPGEARTDHALAGEKMAPVLSLFTVTNETEGIQLSQRLLSFAGAGHTAAIHTNDRAVINAFALAVPASRILVNTPATHGVIGLTTGLVPSLTLGCGFYGGNSTSDNVSFSHLRNLKRLAHFRAPPVGF